MAEMIGSFFGLSMYTNGVSFWIFGRTSLPKPVPTYLIPLDFISYNNYVFNHFGRSLMLASILSCYYICNPEYAAFALSPY